MNKVKEQLAEFAKKYAPYTRVIISNMRLVLLVLFSIMSAYLFLRVDSLVNQEGEVSPLDSPSAVSKKPDRDVISVFNELTEQNVSVESNFDTNRDNPF